MKSIRMLAAAVGLAAVMSSVAVAGAGAADAARPAGYWKAHGAHTTLVACNKAGKAQVDIFKSRHRP